jgi:hypothetical protein
LDDLKETRRYWKLKEEAQDRTLWRTQFGRGYWPVARQTNNWLIVQSDIQYTGFAILECCFTDPWGRKVLQAELRLAVWNSVSEPARTILVSSFIASYFKWNIAFVHIGYWSLLCMLYIQCNCTLLINPKFSSTADSQLWDKLIFLSLPSFLSPRVVYWPPMRNRASWHWKGLSIHLTGLLKMQRNWQGIYKYVDKSRALNILHTLSLIFHSENVI